jgi:hypothetical protein
MVKPRVFATINREIYQEILEIHTEETNKAKDADRVVPKESHTLEMLLRKGINKYKSELK